MWTLKRLLKTPLLLVFLTQPGLSPGQPERVPVASQELQIDGSIGTEEWGGGAVHELKGGGQVFLQADAAYLYVGVRGPAPGWAHVYLGSRQAVSVLHASAALGRAVYEAGSEGRYRNRQSFEWGLRQTGSSAADQRVRTDYLATHHWVANNTNMGAGNEIEFQISRVGLIEDHPWLAIVYASDAHSPHFWPADLLDDTLKQELIFGNTPESMEFQPQTWKRIAITP